MFILLKAEESDNTPTHVDVIKWGSQEEVYKELELELESYPDDDLIFIDLYHVHYVGIDNFIKYVIVEV